MFEGIASTVIVAHDYAVSVTQELLARREEGTDVPLAFVWGMLDPVSGAHMAARVRECLPGAPFLALDGVGHWPALEAPERVVSAVLVA